MITAKEVRERWYARKKAEAERAAKKGEAEKLVGATVSAKPAPGGEKVPLALRAKAPARKKTKK